MDTTSENILISASTSSKSMISCLGFMPTTWWRAGASVSLFLINPAKTVQSMGVMGVYGTPVTSSVTGSYWPAKDVGGVCSEELKRVKREGTQRGGRKKERRNPKRIKGVHGRWGASVPNVTERFEKQKWTRTFNRELLSFKEVPLKGTSLHHFFLQILWQFVSET